MSPIRSVSTAHFNPFSPLTNAPAGLADINAVTFDADGKILVTNPIGAEAAIAVAAYNATVGSNTLPPNMTSLVLDEQWASGTLDPMWHINTDLNWGSSGNRIQAFRSANVSISAATSGGSGNSLKLASKREAYSGKDFTAGMIETRPTGTFFPIFGRYESRMKIPHMQGIWPAFWLRQRATASICEVDIMEYFHVEQAGKGRITLHRANNSGTLVSNVNKVAAFFESPTLTPGWHTWAVDILPEGSNVRFYGYLDGALVWSYLDTVVTYWSVTQGTSRADYNFGENYFDIVFQGSQIGGSYLCHPDDPKGYSRWLDSCVSGGTKPNACNTSIGGYPIWTDAANYGGTGLLGGGQVYEIDYVKVWSAM